MFVSRERNGGIFPKIFRRGLLNLALPLLLENRSLYHTLPILLNNSCLSRERDTPLSGSSAIKGGAADEIKLLETGVRCGVDRKPSQL